METCTKCGAPIAEDDNAGSGLGFLEEVTSIVGREVEPPLCNHCREERRLTGAALLDDPVPG